VEEKEEKMNEENMNSEMPTQELCPTGIVGSDPVTEKLRTGAVDSLNAYLIRLLEKKDFCQAQRIGEALKRIV